MKTLAAVKMRDPIVIPAVAVGDNPPFEPAPPAELERVDESDIEVVDGV
jgi:hypothetical protein